MKKWLLILVLPLGLLIYWRLTLAPQLPLQDIHGRHYAAAAWRGHALVINFWATDCPTCRHELPQWTQVWREWHKQGLEIVAVAMQYDQRSRVLDYADQIGLPFTVVYDSDGRIARAWGGVEATPTSVLIDPQGHIVRRYLGEVPADELRNWLQQTLPRR